MKEQDYVQLEVPMPEAMVAHLEHLRVEAITNGGNEFDNSTIVRAIVGAIVESGIDFSSCHDEDDVLEAIKRSKNKFRPNA